MKLPGLRVKDISVFELSPGMKVYDKASNATGVISDVRETSPEWIEAFYTLDGQVGESRVSQNPDLVLLGDK